jgi:hypothetical protein
MSPQLSESKNKEKRNQHEARGKLLHAGFLLGLFFNYEDGGGLFFRNVG